MSVNNVTRRDFFGAATATGVATATALSVVEHLEATGDGPVTAGRTFKREIVA